MGIGRGYNGAAHHCCSITGCWVMGHEPGVLPARAGSPRLQALRCFGLLSAATRSIRRAMGSEMRRLPISHRATVSDLTPRALASWAWVILSFLRRRLNSSGVIRIN